MKGLQVFNSPPPLLDKTECMFAGLLPLAGFFTLKVFQGAHYNNTSGLEIIHLKLQIYFADVNRLPESYPFLLMAVCYG